MKKMALFLILFLFACSTGSNDNNSLAMAAANGATATAGGVQSSSSTKTLNITFIGLVAFARSGANAEAWLIDARTESTASDGSKIPRHLPIMNIYPTTEHPIPRFPPIALDKETVVFSFQNPSPSPTLLEPAQLALLPNMGISVSGLTAQELNQRIVARIPLNGGKLASLLKDGPAEFKALTGSNPSTTIPTVAMAMTFTLKGQGSLKIVRTPFNSSAGNPHSRQITDLNEINVVISNIPAGLQPETTIDKHFELFYSLSSSSVPAASRRVPHFASNSSVRFPSNPCVNLLLTY